MTAATSERVLILAPRGRDAELSCQVLAREGIEAHCCPTGADLIAAVREGAGCALITSEALVPGLQQEMCALLAEQPPWSDFPIVVLVAAGAQHLTDLGNATMLERPISRVSLLAAVRAALRGRRRQYEARAAIHERDQFLAMLGHELRNPLAAIMLASEQIGIADRAMLEKRIAMISRQATHLTRLVNDLLDVARVTSGKLQLQKAAVDIDAVIRSCVEVLEPRAKERGITFALQLGCDCPIEGDGGRLEQVIGNLLTNAIKYSPNGREVHVTTARVGARCQIRVVDQGIGIAPEMLPRVFELFTQANSSLARSDGGLGVGLALVDRLVRLHGGTVKVSSAGLGSGSEFVVELPVGAARIESAREDKVVAAPARPLRVVVVEDNPDLLELTAAVLESLGCTIETAPDGLAGLELITSSRPDLALIDVGLPKLDGYAVAEQLQEKALPTTLIAVTGYGQKNDRDRALAAGFDDHLTKPVRAQTLRKLIEATRQRLAD